MEFEIGLLCPACRRVYQAKFDNEVTLDGGGATTLHCPQCKPHPVLNIITRYKVKELKVVKKYPIGIELESSLKIIKPKLAGIK